MNKYIIKYNQVSNRERVIIANNIVKAKEIFEKEKQHCSDIQVELIERKITDIKEIEPKKEFNFRVDRLLSLWESQEVCIEADTLEEAKAKLMDPNTFDDSNAELLYDTLEPIEKGDEFGNTTEVYLKDPERGFYIYLENTKSL